MDWISAWSRSIVISVIITIVIEMILPENNSKKYIKIVLGIFVVYSIISPVFDFFYNNSVDNIIDKGEAAIEASSSNIEIKDNNSNNMDNAVRNIYSQSLQTEISKLLQNNGYTSEKIEIVIANDETYNISKVDIKIKSKKEDNKKQAQSIVETIEQIVVEIDQKNNEDRHNSVIGNNDKEKIKKLIHENFGVDEKEIIVN